MRMHCVTSHSFVCSWSLSHNSLIFSSPHLHTFQPNSATPDVYAKGRVPRIHSWMWRPRWPAPDAKEMFLNLATAAIPEGRAESWSTENKRYSGIRWLTQGHLKPARNWIGWATFTRLEERERTATNPAPWNGHCRDHTTLPSHFIQEKQGEVPLELLFYSLLVPALPYPAWGAALLAPGQSSNPSLRGMALPGCAAWLKGLHIRCP